VIQDRPVTADRVKQLKNDLMNLTAKEIAENVHIDNSKEEGRDIICEYLSGEVAAGLMA
jgi:hypothetical protein